MSSLFRKIMCFIGCHEWYYGYFQTGEKSKWTGDHIGKAEKRCIWCSTKKPQ